MGTHHPNRIWIAALAAILVIGLALPALANEWEEEQPPQEQPWVETDPSGPAQQPIPPLHRRLPKFHLNHSLVYMPEPLLLRSKPSGGDCGMKLPALIGSAIDFDFRFWYLFVGARMTFAGDDSENLSVNSYALRGGAFIPFGERFAVIHAFWIGAVDWNATGVDLDDHFSDMDTTIEGVQLGTSLGFRVMLTSWLGLTADVGVTTSIFDSGAVALEQGPGYTSSPSSEVRLNAVQLQTGLVFAW